MKKLKMIDLFSGGGGFSYAAEKLVGGYETIQFVEIDPYCQKVLKKHWPNVPIHDDIKTYKPKPYSADIISAGFPCTDISVAGKGLGITKETRSGLFYELMRVVCVVRAKYVILENVAAILNNGMGIVLGELSKARFDAEWATFRASDYVRACHHRDRWWLLATNRDFTNSDNNGSSTTEKSRGFKKTNGRAAQGQDKARQFERSSQSTNSGAIQFNAPNTDSIRGNENVVNRRNGKSSTQKVFSDRNSVNDTQPNLADTQSAGLQGRMWDSEGGGRKVFSSEQHDRNQIRSEIGRTDRISSQKGSVARWRNTKHQLNPNWREYGVEPAICRNDDGIASGLFTNRTERLKLLGNGLIPQCAAIPLQRILDLEKEP